MPGVIAAVVAMPYLYRQVDDRIRRKVEGLFAERYPRLKIDIRSAARVEGQGIEIRGLSILDPEADDPRDPIVHLDEMFLRCTTELADMVTDDVCIEHVTIRRPVLRAVRRADGSWNVERLFPLPKLKRRPPDVTIESGTIELLDPTRDPPSSLTLRDFNATVAAIRRQPDSSGFVRQLKGSARGDHLERIEIAGLIDPESGKWSLSGSVDKLSVSSDLAASLPGPAAAQCAALGRFAARADLAFQIVRDPAITPSLRFEIGGKLTEGRVDAPTRLPYPLTEVTASILANNDGFALKEVSARAGAALLTGTIEHAGFASDSPWSVRGKIRQLELDAQLQAVLPDNLRQAWEKYSPGGRIDADVTLGCDGRGAAPRLVKATVACHDLSFCYREFPFRLEHGDGMMVLENDVLTVRDMTVFSGSRPVRISTEIQQATTSPFGWFEAQGEALPIDRKLYIALKKPSREVFDALSPDGWCNFWLRVNRNTPDETPTQHLIATLGNCSIRYKDFPYPIRNIQGSVERFPDGSWAFTNLTGQNDTGEISCAGRMAQSPQGKLLSLTFKGKNLALDEELRDALRPAMRQVWDDVKPQGIFDLKLAQIDWLVGQAKPTIVVEAAPQAGTASIEPKAIPYKLENLEGTLTYRDGHVNIHRFRGWHGPVQVSNDGSCDFLPDGSWHLRLSGIVVDRLRFDRELIQALPTRLRKGLAELNPRGPMRIERGTFDVWHSGVIDQPLRAAWDLTLGFQQAAVDCGVRLENMNGETTLAGQFDGQHFFTEGELNVESLTYKGYQFTDVKGPVWVDDNRALLGTWVARRDGQAQVPQGVVARPLTGRLFGGEVKGDAWSSLEQVPRYSVWAELHGADLRLLAKDTMPGQQELAGRFGGQMDLRGKGRTIDGLQGRGVVWLREANVYQLPVMVAMLKIISGIRQPDTNAFSSADIRYAVNGKHIYLSPIKFTGDAISLIGQGEMGFDSRIDLAFYAMMGRDEFQVPLIRPLLGEAAQRTMTIKVNGTLQEPQTSKEVLPGVKEALRRLQTDLQAGAAPVEPRR